MFKDAYQTDTYEQKWVSSD